MSPRQKLTTTGGRTATTRHIFGERVLSVGMPINQPAPTGWRWVPLSEVAKMESGHTPSREHPEYWNGDIPWLGVRDAGKNHGTVINDTSEHTNQLGIDNSSARLLPAGTICLSRGGTVGYVVMLGRPMCTSQGFANWICGPDLDPRFLMHLLLSEKKGLDRFAIGTTIQTIYYPDLKALHVCIPPLPEQQRIVGLLDEAFNGIAIAKANVEQNLQNARALFEACLQSAFTQGALEREGEKKGQGADKKSVWQVVPMGQLCRITSGSSDTQDAVTDGEFAFFDRSKTIKRSNRFLYDCEALIIPGEGAAFLPRYFNGKFDLHQRAYAIFDLNPKLNIHFLYFCLYFQADYFPRVAVGATVKSLRRRHFEEFPVPVPPLAEQQRIVRLLGKLQSSADSLTAIQTKKTFAFDYLKQSLLSQAFSGGMVSA